MADKRVRRRPLWPLAVIGVATIGALTGVGLGMVEKTRDAAARMH